MDKHTGPKVFLVVLPGDIIEILQDSDKYDRTVCDDMFKLFVWDCYAWRASPSRRLQIGLAIRLPAQFISEPPKSQMPMRTM